MDNFRRRTPGKEKGLVLSAQYNPWGVSCIEGSYSMEIYNNGSLLKDSGVTCSYNGDFIVDLSYDKTTGKITITVSDNTLNTESKYGSIEIIYQGQKLSIPIEQSRDYIQYQSYSYANPTNFQLSPQLDTIRIYVDSYGTPGNPNPYTFIAQSYNATITFNTSITFSEKLIYNNWSSNNRSYSHSESGTFLQDTTLRFYSFDLQDYSWDQDSGTTISNITVTNWGTGNINNTSEKFYLTVSIDDIWKVHERVDNNLGTHTTWGEVRLEVVDPLGNTHSFIGETSGDNPVNGTKTFNH